MPRKQPMILADAEEVLAFYTRVMRGETMAGGEVPAIADQCRAAEMLGRHFRLFEEKDRPRPDGAAVQAVRETLARMKEAHAD